MADLTRDDILKLARLARISLSDEEVSEFTDEFSEILKYVEQLNAIDTTGLKPTSQVTGLLNVTRPDKILDYGYDPRSLLKNVPKTDNNQIKVKRMIG
jgi:aspartyl-tRNA(Asn)/glutamyl-tRNA(Gln) amidotransferase subunit C